MNKHVKRLLVILAIIAALAACGAAYVMHVLNKADESEDVKAYKAQVEQETQEDTDELVSMIEEATKEAVEEVAAEISVPSASGSGETSGESESSGADSGTSSENQELKAALTSKYHGIMMSQKGAALSKLDSLVAEARGEYIALRSSGTATSEDMGDLAARFYSKAAALEGSMDSSFEAGIAKMSAEFESHGIDPSGVISGFRSEYAGIKEQYRQYYINKAKSS